MVLPYDRRAAVEYAHRWAYGRNPAFYDYSGIGGDCTNFVSQCILAGGGIMNEDSIFGWYYIDGNRKAPAWSGARFLHQFLTRDTRTVGPFARECTMMELIPGDIVQLSFDGINIQHSLLVVHVRQTVKAPDVFVATHSDDVDYRPLRSYSFAKASFLSVEGIQF